MPACQDRYRLTASNIGVQPLANNPYGNEVPPDPQFAHVLSTSSAADLPGATVLLDPADGSFLGNQRYVLGPTALTGADVASAEAGQFNGGGQWEVNISLSQTGTAKFDALTQRQFHAYTAFVMNNQVVSDPLTQPTQTTWSSFNGNIQISLTMDQAKALAAYLNG